MFFSKKEERMMAPLFKEISKNPLGIFKMKFEDNSIIVAKVDTCYETDNGLDEDDEKYEEYNACAMRIEAIIESGENVSKYRIGGLVETNYIFMISNILKYLNEGKDNLEKLK
ncbi:MAG: hypothetical protein PUE01_11365 [Clostridiaceae bacterium]|nr:hypothetical protein [Clostridiaceae bacterium]